MNKKFFMLVITIKCSIKVNQAYKSKFLAQNSGLDQDLLFRLTPKTYSWLWVEYMKQKSYTLELKFLCNHNLLSYHKIALKDNIP